MSNITCPVCHQTATGARQDTEVREVYMDGVGVPGDPGRIPAGVARRMVPGGTTVTYYPCEHEVPA